MSVGGLGGEGEGEGLRCMVWEGAREGGMEGPTMEGPTTVRAMMEGGVMVGHVMEGGRWRRLTSDGESGDASATVEEMAWV